MLLSPLQKLLPESDSSFACNLTFPFQASMAKNGQYFHVKISLAAQTTLAFNTMAY
jgi:hypothetical protein